MKENKCDIEYKADIYLYCFSFFHPCACAPLLLCWRGDDLYRYGYCAEGSVLRFLTNLMYEYGYADDNQIEFLSRCRVATISTCRHRIEKRERERKNSRNNLSK